MKLFGQLRPEISIGAKVIKKDGTVIDLGKVCYDGPWYKVLFWKISMFLKGRRG